jgi:hypothetical protein
MLFCTAFSQRQLCLIRLPQMTLPILKVMKECSIYGVIPA